MPYIKINTNISLTEKQNKILKEVAGQTITTIPGKTETYLMVEINDDLNLYYGGSSEPAMMITLDLYGDCDNESKALFTQELTKQIESMTQIPVQRQYVIINGHSGWGMFGEYYIK